MSLFPDTIAAVLAGQKVECAALVHFAFTSEPIRVWRGHGTLETNDGHQWLALGQLGSMEGISQATNGRAPEATFTLSGVDADIVRLARDEFDEEVRGSLVRVLVQFFGVPDEADPDNQRCLDLPYPVWAGRCMKPRFVIDVLERAVTMTAESLFSLRSRPNASMYTDRDQQVRFPGDKGFEFVGSLVNKTLTWPDF